MNCNPPSKISDQERQLVLPLDQVIQVMRQAHGHDLSLFDEVFLAKSLERRIAGAVAEEDTAAYLQRLAEDRTEADALFQSLNIGYSEFFRDPLVFALLEKLVLPGLVEAKGKTGPAELRVWSAGCSAGQEAWSVAILLEDLSVAQQRPVPFRIIATDVSDAALAVARQGVYDHTAVQNVRVKHLRNFFSAEGESYVVASQLRARVDFSTYDLLDERSVCPPVSLYGAFDLILCCNLLFYYRPETRRHILDKVCRALGPGGYFVTGEVDREFVAQHDGFSAVAPPAAVFQKRRSEHE